MKYSSPKPKKLMHVAEPSVSITPNPAFGTLILQLLHGWLAPAGAASTTAGASNAARKRTTARKAPPRFTVPPLETATTAGTFPHREKGLRPAAEFAPHDKAVR